MLRNWSLPHEHVQDPIKLVAFFLQVALDLRRQQQNRAPAARSAVVCKAAAAQAAEESPEAVAHQKFIRGSPSKVSPCAVRKTMTCCFKRHQGWTCLSLSHVDFLVTLPLCDLGQQQCCAAEWPHALL